MGGNIVEKNENKNRMKRPKRAQLSSYIYVNDHKLCGSNPSTPVVLKKKKIERPNYPFLKSTQIKVNVLKVQD